nr:uncharacterized protein LOC117226650 [Megalopta genalis]
MGPSGLIIQANLNHSARAQDLLVQYLAERGAGLAVVAEPYRVPDHPHWMGDSGGSAAIYWVGRPGSPACSVIERDWGFLAVDWGGTAVVAIYAPPRRSLEEFEQCLDEVGRCVSRCLSRPVLVLGDLNAKATAWGSPRTDARGREATAPAARHITGWRVAEEVETLSDHRYIVLGLSAVASTPQRRPANEGSPQPRWALKRLDQDALMAAAHVVAWPGTPAGPVDRKAEVGVLVVARHSGFTH